MENITVTKKNNIAVIKDVRDFDLENIFECGQCFRWVPDGSGGYTGAAGSFAAQVSYDHGILTVDASGGDEAFWRNYFDLDTDYGEIKKRLTDNEPAIRAAVEYGSGIRILRQDPFETIISFIISQNNNIPRIRKNIESLCEKYGEPVAVNESEHSGSVMDNCDDMPENGQISRRRFMYAFPKPEALADAGEEDLAAMKLGYRSSYIIRAAKKYLEDGCPSCREELLGFHGIGPKVANCIMLFGLRDTAAFPVDTWVKQIMNDMYGFDMNDVKGMQAFASDKFGDLAGYAQQYLFYYYRDRK